MLYFMEFPNRIPSRDILEEPKLVGFSAESFAMDLNDSDSDRDFTWMTSWFAMLGSLLPHGGC